MCSVEHNRMYFEMIREIYIILKFLYGLSVNNNMIYWFHFRSLKVSTNQFPVLWWGSWNIFHIFNIKWILAFILWLHSFRLCSFNKTIIVLYPWILYWIIYSKNQIFFPQRWYNRIVRYLSVWNTMIIFLYGRKKI